MTTKNILNTLAAWLLCGCLLAVAPGCSSSDDPHFTASENDAPRILNTDIPEGTGGQPGVIATIERTQNFTYEVIVTPADYTAVTWFIDDELVAEGKTIDIPVLAGTHTLEIVATTTMGQQTSRTCQLVVRPAAGDPVPGNDIHERLVKPGTTATLHGDNIDKVAKVIIGGQQATATYRQADDCVEYTVPNLPDGSYSLTVADATGFVYGAGEIELSQAPEYPVPLETVLLEGSFVIDWDAAICNVPAEAWADVPVGSTIKIYYEVPDAEYHNMRIVTTWWTDVPGGAQIDVTADTPNPFTLTFTDEFKALVTEQGGMSCVGFGYTVTRITYE